MRIGILSTHRHYYSTDRLMQEAARRGYEAVFIDPLRCRIVIDREGGRVLHPSLDKKRPDLVIARVGPAVAYMGTGLARQFEFMGIPVINTSTSMTRARDKLQALQCAAFAGLPVPRTALTAHLTGMKTQLRELGGTPIVVKTVQGTQGLGVMLAESPEGLRSLLETLWGLKQNVLLQEFVAESRGRDIRVLVLGDSVIAAMRRKAAPDEFRSNIHRRGKGEAFEPDPAMSKAALTVAGKLGLLLAGIDFLDAGDSFSFMEANSSPGIRELERVTGENIAGKIIEFAARRVQEGN